MTDYSDGINWQRPNVWSGLTPIKAPGLDPQTQAIRQVIQQLQASGQLPQTGQATQTASNDFRTPVYTPPNTDPNMPVINPPNVDPNMPGFRTRATAYSPQRGGDAMEGGYAASRPGPDGQAMVRTLEDYAAGRSPYITVAGDPSQYGKRYTIPSITWTDSQGRTQTSSNVPAIVHDTGGAFKGAGTSHFDIPVARDMSNRQMNAQPFLRGGVQFVDGSGWQPPSRLGGPQRDVPSEGYTPGVTVATRPQDTSGQNGYTKDRGMIMGSQEGVGWRDAPPMSGQTTFMSEGNGWRDTPPFQTAQLQSPDTYRKNFGGGVPGGSPATQPNAFTGEVGWGPDGTITWADGTKQQLAFR